MPKGEEEAGGRAGSSSYARESQENKRNGTECSIRKKTRRGNGFDWRSAGTVRGLSMLRPRDAVHGNQNARADMDPV